MRTYNTSHYNTLLKLIQEWKEELLVVFICFVAMNLIFISEAFRGSLTVDRTAAGLLGDFVGGYFGALFALVSIVLLIRTLKIQHSANLKQSFENKLFELIRMHRDNVAELSLQETSGTTTNE